jgi:hypothetical protein
MNITEKLTKEAGWLKDSDTFQLTNKEEREVDYFMRKQEKYGFETSWSIFEIRAFAYPSPYKAKWMTNGINNDIKVKLPNHKLSAWELWKHADELYKLLGDTEHRFIESFELKGDAIEVGFGS